MRAGTGACPVRARLLYPSVVTNKDSIRVILLLFGVHNHIYPVCKPPVSAIESAVAEKPNASVRDLQKAIADHYDGAIAAPRHIRSLRAAGRAAKSPHGQDILGVMVLRRRANGDHAYIRGVIDNNDYKIVLL